MIHVLDQVAGFNVSEVREGAGPALELDEHDR
jgi:hypothetical protein